MGIFPLPISRFRSTLRNPRSPVHPRTGLLLFVSKQAASALADRRTYFNVKSMFAKCETRRYAAQPGAPQGWPDLRRKIIRASPKTGHCRPSKNERVSPLSSLFVGGRKHVNEIGKFVSLFREQLFLGTLQQLARLFQLCDCAFQQLVTLCSSHGYLSFTPTNAHNLRPVQ